MRAACPCYTFILSLMKYLQNYVQTCTFATVPYIEEYFVFKCSLQISPLIVLLISTSDVQNEVLCWMFFNYFVCVCMILLF